MIKLVWVRVWWIIGRKLIKNVVGWVMMVGMLMCFMVLV